MDLREKSLFCMTTSYTAFREQRSLVDFITVLKELRITSVMTGNPAPDLCTALHNVDIKIYAEVHCFEGEHLWQAYPESRPVTPNGDLLAQDDWYCGVNPAVEPVRQHLFEEFKTLVHRSDVDGIWLDFIRWPCHWEVPRPQLIQTSFDQATLKQFSADMNIALPDRHKAEHILQRALAAWADWKCGQITSWVKSARAYLSEHAPNKTLGLFGVPWLTADFEGAIRHVVGQDYPALAPYVDVFTPMTYHWMCGRPVSWIAEVVQGIKTITGKPVIPIVQAVDKPAALPGKEYADSLEIGLNNDHGVAIFELDGVLKEDRYAITRSVLQS
jgi:hypothetical protein